MHLRKSVVIVALSLGGLIAAGGCDSMHSRSDSTWDRATPAGSRSGPAMDDTDPTWSRTNDYSYSNPNRTQQSHTAGGLTNPTDN